MSSADNPANTKFSTYLRDPLTQGIATGLMSLIPARDYPQWLRRSLIWGPLLIASAGGAYLGGNPKVVQELGKRFADAEHPEQTEQTEFDALTEQSAQVHNASQLRSITQGLFAGAATGAVVSGAMIFGFWADEKIDRGLRKAGIRCPRVVMGAAVGALAGWSASQEQEWDE